VAGFVSRTQAAGALQGLPAPLASAITSAATQYDVPAGLLVGIWGDESGSTYPNPAVNSEGYGGLFGLSSADLGGVSPTTASTQQQADTAARILASGLQQSDGNVPEALTFYTTGRTTPIDQGYVSTVTGRAGVSSGTVNVPTATSTPADPTSGGSSHGVSSGGSLWGSIFGSVESLGGDLLSTAEGEAEGLWGDTLGSLEGSISSGVSFLKAMAWLIHPLTWLRFMEGIAGVGLAVGGILVATGAAEKLESAVGAAGKIAA
jgi:hypothetical protein